MTVGYIDNLEILYSRHPSLKSAMQSQNRYMFDVGRRSIEHHLTQQNKSITRENCILAMQELYEKSTVSDYR